MNTCKPSPAQEIETLKEQMECIRKEFAKAHRENMTLSDLYVDAVLRCREIESILEARQKCLDKARKNAAKLELIVSDNKIRMSKEMRKEVLDLLRF